MMIKNFKIWKPLKLLIIIILLSSIVNSKVLRPRSSTSLLSQVSRMKQTETESKSRRDFELHSQLANHGENGKDSRDITAAATNDTPAPFRPSSLPKINSLMFFFYATLGSAMPFLPIYYRRIGISDSVIGLLGAITPSITFIVSPLWGALADKTGKHKEIMIATFIGSVLLRSGLSIGNLNVFCLSLIVACTAILNAPVKPLMDGAVMSMLEDKKQYGRSRLFGQLGFGMGSYFVGPLIAKSIRSMFAVQGLLAIPTLLLMLSFRPSKESRKPKAANPEGTTDIAGAIQHILQDKAIIIFFSMVFIIGVSSGIIENFAYVRISEVGGGEGNCLGVCRLISSIAGGPMFWLSGEIAQKVGINGIIAMSLVSYVLRFFNYALINNPWQALPAEILRGVTFATFWAGSTYHVYNASPKGLTATMLGLLNGIYGGIGQSVGALIGGYLSKHWGIAKAFSFCGLIDASILGLFSIYLVNQWRNNASSKNAVDLVVDDKKKQQ